MNSNRRTLMLALVLLNVLTVTGFSHQSPPTLVETFQEPGPAFRGKPFWSWNGELEEGELKRQIQVMQEMGLGGFFMHSRTGLATEYLGDEWFELTNACADEGERLEMEAWLYDEDRWPSGTAGGMVTKNPAYRMKFMSLRTVPAEQFGWFDGIYAAFACDLDELAFTNCQRITNDTPCSAYPRKTILVFTIEEFAKSSFYNGYTMVDSMNRDATDHYIQLTHERYKEECGDRFGGSIKGIFTDEPHRGCVMGNFSARNANQRWMTPWTDTLPQEYKRQFKQDIVAQLPDLFLQRNGERVSPVKWQYMELCQQLFLKNWAAPLFDWCEENDLLFTGHALHEDSLTAQATMQGSLMRFYEYEHIPGVDCLTEGNRNYWVVKQCSSASRQLGRPWILSELYGVTGWQFDFEGHKYVGDWQALFGVNLRCHHLSWYTMEGQAKRDYPASMLHQSAWYKDYEPVETYFARLGLLLQQGKPKCDLLVINPVESLWCQIHVDWINNIATPKDPEVRSLEKAYRDLFHWLTGAQIDFDYGDEEMLSRLHAITEHEDAPPRLKLGQSEYRAILVPKMTTVRKSTLDILTRFARAGGTVLFAGDPPPYVDAIKQPQAQALSQRVDNCDFARDAVVNTLRQLLPPQPQILDSQTGNNLTDIFCQMRQDGPRTILVAMNMNRNQAYDAVTLKLPTQGQVTEWDCFTGQRYRIPSQQQNKSLVFSTNFPAVGTRVFVIEPQTEDLPPKPTYTETKNLTCDGPFVYALDEDNVCVLDLARYQIADANWQEATEVLKIDQAVRTHYGLAHRSGKMVQPWYAKKHFPQPKIQGTVRMAFDFDIATLPQNAIELGIEHPEDFTITVNGKPIAGLAKGWWVDRAIQRIGLPLRTLRKGCNTLELRTDFSEDKNIEALYLLGDFGVEVTGTSKTLIALPEQLKVGDVTTQGLPFYSGTIRYQIPIPNRADAQEELIFVCPDYEGACVKVSSPGQASRLLPWPPYEVTITQDVKQNQILDVDVILTRRNSFGPLHLVPKRSGAYGPGHWVTEGDRWSDDYQLWEAGLLKAPKISVRTAKP